MSSKRKSSISDATPASDSLPTKMSMPTSFLNILKQNKKMVTPGHRNRTNHNKPTGAASAPKSVPKMNVSNEKTVSVVAPKSVPKMNVSNGKTVSVVAPKSIPKMNASNEKTVAVAAFSGVTSPPSLEDFQELIYVEDFIRTDDLADDVVRKTSRLLELHCQQQSLLELLQVNMEGLLDRTLRDTDDTSSVDALQRLLVLTSEMGDDRVQIAQEIEDMVGDKLHDLETGMRRLMITNFSSIKSIENVVSSANPGTGQAKIPPCSPKTNSSKVVVSSPGSEGEPRSSSKDSCPSFKKQKTLLSFDGLALPRGNGHQRSCKSRNPPNYTGICMTPAAGSMSVKKKIKKAPLKGRVKNTGVKKTVYYAYTATRVFGLKLVSFEKILDGGDSTDVEESG